MTYSDIAIDGMMAAMMEIEVEDVAVEIVPQAEKTPAEKIALLNDEFRMGIAGPVSERASSKGMCVMTGGFSTLSLEMKARVMTWTACFGNFTPENDPHGEHDQAGFKVKDKSFRWAFTYYAKNEDGTPDFEHGSENPSDEEKTYRVLTVMTGEEY